MSASAPAPPAARIIAPQRGCQGLDLRRLWAYRELLWFLALRDVRVRYKQTLLGASWALFQPLVMMVVLSAFFGRFLSAEQTGGPYPVFFYAAMLPWSFFAAAVNSSTQSLVGSANLIRKVYFPRVLIPVAAVGAPLVDYAVAFSVLMGLMAWYAMMPSVQLILLPLLVLITMIAALGVGVGLAGLAVVYRDVRHVVPFMLQVWFFLTPVIYPVQGLPAHWQWVLRLNPMGGTIEAFRAVVLGTPVDWFALGCSAGAALLMLVAGLIYFNHAERRFADLV